MTRFNELKAFVLLLSVCATLPLAEAHKHGEAPCNNINCQTMNVEVTQHSTITPHLNNYLTSLTPILEHGKHPLESNTEQRASKKAKISSQSASNQLLSENKFESTENKQEEWNNDLSTHHSNTIIVMNPDSKVNPSEVEMALQIASLQQILQNPTELRKKTISELEILLKPFSKAIKKGMHRLQNADPAKLIPQSLLFLTAAEIYFSKNYSFNTWVDQTNLPFFKDLFETQEYLISQRTLGNWNPPEATEILTHFYRFFSLFYQFRITKRTGFQYTQEDIQTIILVGESVRNGLERPLNNPTFYSLFTIYSLTYLSGFQDLLNQGSETALRALNYQQEYKNELSLFYPEQWPRIKNHYIIKSVGMMKTLVNRGIEPIKYLKMAIHLIETEMNQEINVNWTPEETANFIRTAEQLKTLLGELRAALEVAKNPLQAMPNTLLTGIQPVPVHPIPVQSALAQPSLQEGQSVPQPESRHQ